MSVIGMKPEVIDQFRAIEPYKDGQGTDLWVLHELNNIDKHRAIVAVGARYIAVNVGGASLLDHFSAEVREMWQGITLPDLHLKPKDELCPLKAGDELFIDLPEAEFRPRQFTFDVALYEPDVVKPGPIIEIVRRLSEAVSRTITLFKPFLS